MMNQKTPILAQVTGLSIDAWIKKLKDNNPILADVKQSPDVEKVIGKIKAMQDRRQAMETFSQLGTLQALMNMKSAQEAK